jgi:hypothetical protein
MAGRRSHRLPRPHCRTCSRYHRHQILARSRSAESHRWLGRPCSIVRPLRGNPRRRQSHARGLPRHPRHQHQRTPTFLQACPRRLNSMLPWFRPGHCGHPSWRQLHRGRSHRAPELCRHPRFRADQRCSCCSPEAKRRPPKRRRPPPVVAWPDSLVLSAEV